MSYGDYPDLSKVKKILVIKLRNFGDVVLTTPVFRTLKATLPKASIDALIYQEGLPLLEKAPFINQCFVYDKAIKKGSFPRRLGYEYSLIRAIRKERYDLVFNLTEGDRGAFVSLFSGAKFRVGYDTGPRRKTRIYSHLAKLCGQNRHTVEKNLDALRRVGIFPEKEETELFFPLEKSALLSMKKKLGHNKPFLLIHPTSRWRFKCWPMAKVRSLIERFLEEGTNVVLVSGPDPVELDMTEVITNGLQSPHFQNFSGQVTLEELGALIHLARGTLCMDSVSFHIASALKACVAAIFGPTSPITWGSWQNPNAVILRNQFPCMPCYRDGCGGSKISDCIVKLQVATVYEALSRFLHKDPQGDPTGLKSSLRCV
ncbi:MAG: putative lipopolysaccharide heptosyltransferase III [Chlamydiota bacterium]